MLVVLSHGEMTGFSWGTVGVDIFFVLSGFLITNTLLSEYDRTGTVSLLQFWRRRALRLLPALIIFCAIFALYALLILDEPRVAIVEPLLALTYISNWTRALELETPKYLGHLWTLAVEEQFYLVWPLVFVGLMKLSRCTRISLLIVAVAGVAAHRAYIDISGGSIMRMYNGTDTRCDSLLIGAIVAYLLRGSARDFIKSIAYLWPVFAFAFLWIAADGEWTSHYMFRWGLTGIALCSGVMVAILYCNDTNDMSRLLSAGPLVWLGQRSYGIYLWHGLISFVLIHSTWYFWPLYAGSTLAIAAASFRFVEMPFLRMRYTLGQ